MPPRRNGVMGPASALTSFLRVRRSTCSVAIARPRARNVANRPLLSSRTDRPPASSSLLQDQGITARHGTGYQPNAPPPAIAEDEAPAANAVAGPGPSSSAAASVGPSGRGANLDPEQLRALAESDDEEVVVRKKRKVAQVSRLPGRSLAALCEPSLVSAGARAAQTSSSHPLPPPHSLRQLPTRPTSTTRTPSRR